MFILYGLFLANYSAAAADWYWSAMFPILGLVCLGHHLIAGDTGAAVRWKIVVKQTRH
jgi:GMP synthase-like glutamine amidotransferase